MRAHLLGPAHPLAAGLVARLTPAALAEARAIVALDANAPPEATISAAETAIAQGPDGTALLLLATGGATWEASRRLALIAAFVRHAARAFAPRGIRANAIALCAPGPLGWNAAWPDAGAIRAAPATDPDIARVAWFLLTTLSVTGQFVRLTAP